MPKVKESCHFYMVHRKDAEFAEVFYEEILSLRLCASAVSYNFWHCSLQSNLELFFSVFQDELLILRWLIALCIDPLNCGDRALKNPRAALTLPGGDLILVTVKHDQNPNSTLLTMPRRRSP